MLTNKPHTQRSLREQFLDFFRSEHFARELTVEDRREVFLDVLEGASDLTPELIGELLDAYGMEYSQIMPRYVYLVYSSTDYDCLADAVQDGAVHTFVETVDAETVSSIINRLPSIHAWEVIPVQ